MVVVFFLVYLAIPNEEGCHDHQLPAFMGCHDQGCRDLFVCRLQTAELGRRGKGFGSTETFKKIFVDKTFQLNNILCENGY